MKKLSMVFLVIFFLVVLLGMSFVLQLSEVEAEDMPLPNNPMGESSQWAFEYRGPEADAIQAITQTGDGGFVMAGHTDSFGTGNLDLWVVKLTPDGSVLWQKTYGDDNLEYASDITEAENGDLLVAGSMFIYWPQGVDMGYWILRLSSTGEIIWQKLFTDVFSDQNRIIETSDQGIVIAGGWSQGSHDGTSIMKLDLDGNVLWQKLYIDQVFLYDGAYFSIDETLDGGFIVTSPNSEGDQWLSKLDSQGNIEWQKLLSGAYFRVTVNAIGNDGFYISGATQTSILVLKFAPNGDILWQKSLSSESAQYLWSADTTNDEGIILAGKKTLSGVSHYWLIRLDLDGTLLWDKIYSGGDIKDVEQTTDSGYIVVGNGYPGNNVPYYPWALKDENSITPRKAIPTLDGNMDVFALKVDANGDINGCNVIGTTNTIITDTNITLFEASVTPIAITPNPTDSVITPHISNATEELVCYFSLTSTPASTLSSTPTNTPTITLTPTPIPTTILTPTPTATQTPTVTETLSPTATHTPTQTSTITPIPSPFTTPTLTPPAPPIFQFYLPIIHLP